MTVSNLVKDAVHVSREEKKRAGEWAAGRNGGK